MAVKVKDVTAAAQKWVNNASTAGPAYANGVANAGGTWQANAAASESSYDQGVQQAIASKRYSAGINPASAQKYTTRATTLGQQRYGPGVTASKDVWAAKTKPYLDKIASLTLPPRGPVGDPGNPARSVAVGQALRALKLGH